MTWASSPRRPTASSSNMPGEQVEKQSTRDLFREPRHPYTAALLAALPERAAAKQRAARRSPASCPAVRPTGRGLPVFAALRSSSSTACDARRGPPSAGARARRDATRRSCAGNPLARARPHERGHSRSEGSAPRYEVRRGFFGGTRTVKARPACPSPRSAGKTLAVVGESGCGKSTLGRMLTMIEAPTRRLAAHRRHRSPRRRRPSASASARGADRLQNPYGSLNPRQTIGAALEEPLIINSDLGGKAACARRAPCWLAVGLRPEHYRSLSAYVLRRPAPADRHRPRA